jgi:hypothetical protein
MQLQQDMFSEVFRASWTQGSLRRMNTRLLFHYNGASRFEEVEDLWADEPVTYGPPILCPATALSTAGLIELATSITVARPELERFSLLVGCCRDAESYCEDGLGLACWQLEYPPAPSTVIAPEGGTSPNGRQIINVMFLPINEDAAVTVTIHHEHRDFACCSAVRQHERYIVGEVAGDARADPSGYGFITPDNLSERDSSDTDSSDSDVGSDDSGWVTEDEADDECAREVVEGA